MDQEQLQEQIRKLQAELQQSQQQNRLLQEQQEKMK